MEHINESACRGCRSLRISRRRDNEIRSLLPPRMFHHLSDDHQHFLWILPETQKLLEMRGDGKNGVKGPVFYFSPPAIAALAEIKAHLALCLQPPPKQRTFVGTSKSLEGGKNKAGLGAEPTPGSACCHNTTQMKQIMFFFVVI